MVGPLLALLLGDGKELVTQIVPASLLDFSRSCLRSTFSSLIQKPVYTFTFNRFQSIDKALYHKLSKAIQRKAILITTPTDMKSFQLKFIQTMHLLDECETRTNNTVKAGFSLGNMLGISGEAKAAARVATERAALVTTLKQQANECVRVLKLFRSGVTIMDEVDTILHPLKSELNWV